MSQKYAAAFSFGKEKKDADKKKSDSINLGPGSYTDIDLKHLGSKAPNYSFSKVPRAQTAKTTLATPGPGSYTHTEFQKHIAPKFSIAKNKKSLDLFMTDGGSQYLQSSIQKINTSCIGPGQYDLDTSFSKIKPRLRKIAISKSARSFDFGKNNKVPGPGSYEGDVKVIKSNFPKYTIGKQSKVDPLISHRQKELIPGPGVYEISTSIGTGQKVN